MDNPPPFYDNESDQAAFDGGMVTLCGQNKSSHDLSASYWMR